MKKINKIFLKIITAVTVFILVNCVAFITPTANIPDDSSIEKTDNASVKADEGYTFVASKGELKLYLDYEKTYFYVENTVDGSKWYSSPINAENDSYASGITMTELRSSVLAVCHSVGAMGGSSFETLNSYSSSVLNESFSIKEIENGFEITYTFDEDVLTVPMRVALSEKGLSVKLLTSKMKISDEISVESISLLPYFCSGGLDDTGYLVVPDGCGGIIKFNNGKSAAGGFSKRVYGENITETEMEIENVNDPTRITLPFFAIKKNSTALLATIKKGASFATIEGYTNGTLSENANVYARFELYSNTEYAVSSTSTTIFEKRDVELSDIELEYYFLSGENADYSGVASKYREELINEGVLKEKEEIKATPYLSVYGGIVAKRSIFGFLVDTVIPMTTTEEVYEILGLLEKEGIASPVVNYKNWNKQELVGKSVKSFSVSNKLNSKKASLNKLLEDDSFSFYPAISDMLTYTKQSIPFTKYLYSISDISGINVYKQNVSKTTMKEYGKRIYFLNYNSADKFLDKFLKSVNKKDINKLALGNIGTLLYEDFGKNSVKRDGFEKLFTEKIEALSKDRELLLDNPNLYALKYADDLINIPTMTDANQLIDAEIPFVQMVLGGCLRFGSNSLNYTDDNTALLKVLETGSMPHYFVYYGDEDQLKATEYSDLCNGNYQSVLPKLVSVYKGIEELYGGSENVYIVSHKLISEGVSVTTYSNGTSVYTNYTEGDYSFDGDITVSAKDYVIKEAGKK